MKLDMQRNGDTSYYGSLGANDFLDVQISFHTTDQLIMRGGVVLLNKVGKVGQLQYNDIMSRYRVFSGVYVLYVCLYGVCQ